MGVAVVSCAFGCGSRTNLVPMTEHPPNSKQVAVTTAPPQARVEVLPLARGTGCRWLGGDYERAGSTWRWRKGQWVKAPKGCHYARASTRYEETRRGTVLIHRPAAWYPDDPSGSCEVAVPCEDAAGSSEN